MSNRDLVLLETVKTHRARLTSAFIFGALDERRLTNDNVRRLIGSIVLAAVACAGCVGFSFVSGILGQQAAAQRQQAAQGPATGPISASDTFDRQSTAGWSSAQRGGRWTTLGPSSAYAVTNGRGTIALNDSALHGGYLAGILEDRTDLQVTLRRTTSATRGTVTAAVLGRRVSSTQDYRLVTGLRSDGSVAVALLRVAEPTQVSNGQEQLSPTVILFSNSDQRSDQATPISIRFQVVGTAPTTLRAKIWQAGASEPPDWTLTATDTTAELQRPGSVGLTAAKSGSSETLGLAVDDLIARVAP